MTWVAAYRMMRNLTESKGTASPILLGGERDRRASSSAFPPSRRQAQHADRFLPDLDLGEFRQPRVRQAEQLERRKASEQFRVLHLAEVT
jgi:hypothetical protein